MRILAYDTSGAALTAALAVDGKVVVETGAGFPGEAPAPGRSDALIPMLEKLLRRARWKPSGLQVLAVGVGPGSFTGLRVGVAAAKMLAYAWGIKIVAVSSLEALASSAGAGLGSAAKAARIPVAIDARRGRIYAALFEKKGSGLRTLIKPMLTTLEAFRELAGNGQARCLPAQAPVVRARDIASLAYEKAGRKEFVTADDLEPLYLYPKDCHVTKKP
jgi:tRNA threonylcarbamoyladenosine biosynthesis protein TsaB